MLHAHDQFIRGSISLQSCDRMTTGCTVGPPQGPSIILESGNKAVGGADWEPDSQKYVIGSKIYELTRDPLIPLWTANAAPCSHLEGLLHTPRIPTLPTDQRRIHAGLPLLAESDWAQDWRRKGSIKFTRGVSPISNGGGNKTRVV